MKETNVTINVTLDENNIPEKIVWSAPDGGVSDFPAKAMLLSLWDGNNKESLKMDLWVKDMTVEELSIIHISEPKRSYASSFAGWGWKKR